MLAPIRSHIRTACLLALLCLLAASLAGFGGAPQPQPEPQTVGPVTSLAASSEAQPAGAVRLSWHPADHAQTHFVIYLKSADAAARNYANAQMAAFRAPNGVITGLEPGAAYNFIAIGMRWNWNNYGVLWGQWSNWATATPSGTPGPSTATTPTSEPQTVGPVTNLAASAAAQPAGAVRLSWNPADHAQTHFVIYLKSADAAADNYANAQMAAFSAPNGVISGLEPGAAYNFIAIGMRWNWNNYGVLWGQWSAWVTDAPAAAAGSAAGDRAVLVALYHATDGPNWVRNDKWLSDAPLNEWHGVATNSNGRVIWLELSYNRLTGALPAELGNLANLQSLYFGGNRLTGALPAELGKLANLRGLDLHNNRLTGALPAELGNLANLRRLSLGGNQLTGELPAELGNLANLDALYLYDNQLTGAIPAELGNLANLEDLHLYDNQLTGAIPAELGNLANLQRLYLSSNRLTGAIPAELGNLANLEDLYLSVNQLTGCIPTALRDVHHNDFIRMVIPFCDRVAVTLAAADQAILTAFYNVTGGTHWRHNGNWLSDAPKWYGVDIDNNGHIIRLDLHNNQLTGAIPPDLGNLANLEDLYLSDNQLTGAIPAELGNLANLQWLYLNDNQLTGAIPAELGNLANLQWLYLSDNQLTGAIPAELGNLANLRELYINNNQLTGVIPAELGNLANLQHLHLNNNQLTGVLPAELGNLANLELLYLSDNQLTGGIPAELGNLANLRHLHLGGNQLTGGIPPELGNLANLQWLLLSDNLLTGCIPAALRSIHFDDLASLSLPYCDRAALIVLYHTADGPNWVRNDKWLSDAPLIEWHGVTVDRNGQVIGLDLNNNRLRGTLPPELGSLANLQWLGLSNNQLTGAIPPELGNLANLQRLYIGDNQLTGCIPTALRNVPRNDLADVPLPYCDE